MPQGAAAATPQAARRKDGSSPSHNSGQKRKRGDDAQLGSKSPAIQPKAPKGIYEHLPRQPPVGRGGGEDVEERQPRQVPLKKIVEELVGSVSSSVYTSKVESKVLVLGGRDGATKQSWKRTNKQAAHLRGARRAGAGTGQQSGEGPKGEYGGLLPLNDLWETHIDRLAAAQKATVAGKRSSLANVIKGAELRGAVLKVVKGKCPATVGVEGIVSKETHGTFELVREDGTARIVPKMGSVFNVVVKGALFSLDGSFLAGRRM